MGTIAHTMSEVVTEADQTDICTFAIKANTLKVLNTELAAINEQLNKNRDAKSALEAIIEDKVKLFVGEVFIHDDVDSVNEALDRNIAKAEKHMNDKAQEIMELQEGLNVLKNKLTLKFGKNINLEDD